MPAQNGAAGAFFAHVRGDPERDFGWKLLVKAFGAVLVLAISISFASGLRRKLTHFDARPLPHENRFAGFSRGPGLAETYSLPPATNYHRTSGVQNRFDFLLPAAAALLSLRKVSAKRSGERGKRSRDDSSPTPKASRKYQVRDRTISVPQRFGAPGTSRQVRDAPSRTTPA